MGLWDDLAKGLVDALAAGSAAALDPETQKRMSIHANYIGRIPLNSLATDLKLYLDKLSDLDVNTLQAYLDYSARKQQEREDATDDWDEKKSLSQSIGKLRGIENLVRLYRSENRR